MTPPRQSSCSLSLRSVTQGLHATLGLLACTACGDAGNGVEGDVAGASPLMGNAGGSGAASQGALGGAEGAEPVAGAGGADASPPTAMAGMAPLNAQAGAPDALGEAGAGSSDPNAAGAQNDATSAGDGAGAGNATAPADAGSTASDPLEPGAAGAESTGGAGAESTGGAGADETIPDPAETADPALHFVGRVDVSDPSAPRFAWSGTGFVARFSGPSVAVQLGGGQQYTVVLDGEVLPKLTSSGNLALIADGLTETPHTVEVYRRTEANQGESVLLAVDFGGGQLLAPPIPERRIEVIGDSITCGYGNEGPDMNCGFSADTENHYLTYGAIAARALGAELSTVAWSGKGALCNYGDQAPNCQDPLPDYYDRILPNDAASEWEPAAWPADAVVINLGTNDFSTDGDPTQEEFENAYVGLLERVREAYPDAMIWGTVGPLLTGADLDAAYAGVAGSIATRLATGDNRVRLLEFAEQDAADGYGCDWHPSLTTHEIMAEVLAEAVRAELGW